MKLNPCCSVDTADGGNLGNLALLEILNIPQFPGFQVYSFWVVQGFIHPRHACIQLRAQFGDRGLCPAEHVPGNF